MSDIKVGDLVLQVATCCDEEPSGGMGVVTDIDLMGEWECDFCRHGHDGPLARVPGIANRELHAYPEWCWVPLSWLRKINPPAIPVSTEKEIAA